MTAPKSPPDRIHPAARLHADEVRTGQMSRREFLARSSALGVTAVAAYGLLDLAAPAPALAAGRIGGTLRMNMETRALRDPRLADWSQIANFTRGWLEYLVEYNNDGTIRGMLLDSWSADDTATRYRLNLRPGITWSNGDPFTAEDVIHNLTRWADGTVAGNSMAARLGALQDPATGRANPEALILIDPLTVELQLNQPDIALIANLADYPAAVVHQSYDNGDPALNPIGTGPYLPEVNEVGVRQVLVRREAPWWGSSVYGGPYLDRIEYIDLGADPSLWVAAARSDKIDATYESQGDFIAPLDALGWSKSETRTAATLAVRFNQQAEEFRDIAVRRALQLAVDNAVVLELGYAGLGTVAENHHVCPLHPDYAELPRLQPDPARAREMIVAAGRGDYEFELVSLDDDWQAATCDAVANQLRDAGISIRRRVMPGSAFWTDWKSYPFSATEWNMRPLGVQVLSVAYKSGGAWNESGFSDPEFDQKLTEAMAIMDPGKRRAVMKRLQEILQEQGVLIQPYWRTMIRHADPGLGGVEMHATFEHHHYKWHWIE